MEKKKKKLAKLIGCNSNNVFLFPDTMQTTKEGTGGSQGATRATGGLSLRHSGERFCPIDFHTFTFTRVYAGS